MIKEELIRHLDTLNNIYDKYYFINIDYKEGRNRRTRGNAFRKMNSIIRDCKRHFVNYPVLLDFLTLSCDTDFQKQITLDYFFSTKNFLNELEEFLYTMKNITKTV